MPAKFKISLQYKDISVGNDWEAFGLEIAEGESLIEALSKFLLVVVSVQQRLDKIIIDKLELKTNMNDDDIPY